MKQQGTDWTTWIPFFVCGVFQLILILIYLYQMFVCVGFGYERVADEVVVQGSVDSE
jgi:hypothetical protein